MRLWTLHPRYLDSRGLVAVWREALLAQKVLGGQTRGYTRHPQLIRFQAQPEPVEVIAGYLAGIAQEASRRGFRFDAGKISSPRYSGKLTEARGQLLFEWKHLKRKLRIRSPQRYRQICEIQTPAPHPLFRIVRGAVGVVGETGEGKAAAKAVNST